MASDMRKLAKAGIRFAVREGEAVFARELDNGKTAKSQMYGAGFLISERAAAERAAAERAIEDKTIVFELSEREKQIVKSLNEQEVCS